MDISDHQDLSESRRGVAERLEHCSDEARRARDVIGFGYATHTGGRQIPDERELTSLLGSSRQNIRAGLGLMREEGIIERRRGRGTFVVKQAPIDVFGVSGLGHDVARLGKASYETLFYGECKLPPALTRLFGTSPQDPVVLVQRLSLVGTRPLCVWDNYIGGSYVAIARQVLELGVSDELLEDLLGLNSPTVDLHLEAGLADASVAELLDVNVGQPLLRYERVVKDANDRVAIIGFGYSRGAPNYDSAPFNTLS